MNSASNIQKESIEIVRNGHIATVVINRPHKLNAGIVYSYVHKLRTGEGQVVETSLLEAGLQQTYWQAASYFATRCKARLRSPMRSSSCSSPTDIRIRPSETPACARTSAGTPEWVVDAG